MEIDNDVQKQNFIPYDRARHYVWRGVLLLSPLVAMAGGQEKKALCHIDEFGVYHLIEVAEPAYQTHFDHGDKGIETFYIDADGDGFGSSAMTVEDCTPPDGYAGNSEDCDDTMASVNPDADETPGNGIDDNCDPGTPDNTCPRDYQSLTYENWAAAVSFDVCTGEVFSCDVSDDEFSLTLEFGAFSNCELRDGIPLVRFSHWSAGNTVCEVFLQNIGGVPDQDQFYFLTSVAEATECLRALSAQRALITSVPSCP